MSQLREWQRGHVHLGAIVLVAGLGLLGSQSRAAAQYDPQLRPGDRIIYVQPGYEPRGGLPLRRMQPPPEHEGRLVYQYEGPGDRAGREVIIDPQPLLRDMQRVQKRAARPKKQAPVKREARAPAAQGDLIETEKTSPPVAATPVVQPVAAEVKPEPRDPNRKVRVIPLYKVPDHAGAAPDGSAAK